MKKVDIAFIILHYITLEDTIDCVDSIEKYCYDINYQIIIVDNGSNNNSGELLKKMYQNDENKTIIISKENLGFARGNNLGYSYFKKNFTAEYLVIANNDVCLLEYNLVHKLQIATMGNYDNIAVIGPKILLPNNSINPIYYSLPSSNDIKKRLLKLYVMVFLDSIGFCFISEFLQKKSIGKKVTDTNYNNVQTNVILHGCFLIFTNYFIEHFDVAFDERTFLYCEEELLYLKIHNASLNTLYTPNISILHNEDSSTNAIVKNEKEKRLFKNKELIKSYKILIKTMKEGKNK